ncbi:MAG: sortase [Methanobacteriaceae archaeon]
MKHLRFELIGALILIVVALAISLSSGSAGAEKNHFNNGEVSFDYPSHWKQLNLSDSKVVAFENPNSGLKLGVSSEVAPQGWVKPENFVNNLSESGEYGLKILKQEKIVINGTLAYVNTYEFKADQNISQIKEVWLEKNNVIYSIIFINPSVAREGFLKNYLTSNQQEINMVLESFAVHDSPHPDNMVWGEISVPYQDISYKIRSNTVNEYNSVYHYPESSYPGYNGTIGLLGHHTVYSAPFAHIDQLKTGDLVRIKDYLTQKIYTYEVTSVGDIKWDYKYNPIEFPLGNPDLTLVTCWPPGTDRAAFMVHARLKSIEML